MSRVIVGDLGWCVARLVVNDNGASESLHIVSPADTDEHRYAPCESVALYGRDRIVKLRDFLVSNLNAPETEKASIQP